MAATEGRTDGGPVCLRGGGEAARAARAVDWSNTPLGAPETWPTCLTTTLGILFHSRQPMFLWWGPELIQFYNDAYLPSFGQGKHPAAMGQRGEACWPESWSIIGPEIRAVMEQGESIWHEDQLVPIFRNGRLEDVYWTYGYSPVFDEGGKVAGTLVVCQETTSQVASRRANEDARREAEAARVRLLNLFQDAPAFVCTLTGPEHVFEMVNPLYQRLVGMDRELIGKRVAEALPEVVEQGFIGLLDGVFRRGEAYTAREARLRLERAEHGPPDEVYLTFVYQPRRDLAGAVDGIDVFGFEVTEHVLARQQAQRAADTSRVLAEAIPQQIWTATPEGELDFVNRRVLAYFGASETEVLGSGWHQFVHPDDLSVAGERWAASLSSGAEYEVEFRLRRADGSYRWHLGRAMPLRDDTRRIVQWFGTNTDVDEQKRSRDEAQRRAEFEQHLLGIVSHDLRNPLNVILLGAAALAERDDLDPRAAKSVLRIQSAAQRSGRMISDLLDFTQARLGGGLKIEPRPMDMHQLASEAVEEVRSSYPERELVLHHAGVAEGTWDGDRVTQIFVNLLSNAVHYGSPAHPVTVTVEDAGRDVSIRVHNHGTPIPESNLGSLFQPMQRGTTANRSARSVGLGLYIVSEIAREHGGSVDVHSSAEAGTTFTIRLPRHATNERRA